MTRLSNVMTETQAAMDTIQKALSQLGDMGTDDRIIAAVQLTQAQLLCCIAENIAVIADELRTMHYAGVRTR